MANFLKAWSCLNVLPQILSGRGRPKNFQRDGKFDGNPNVVEGMCVIFLWHFSQRISRCSQERGAQKSFHRHIQMCERVFPMMLNRWHSNA